MARWLPLVLVAGLAVVPVTARASAPSLVRRGEPPSEKCPDGGRGIDPLAELRQSDLALASALHRRAPDWSPEAEANAARVQRLLAEILDYESIARQALGARWDALTPGQRAAFLALFSPLTNRAFVASAERHVAVTYDSEAISGPEATVVVTPSRAGGDGPERVEYKLGERCGRWRIHDVVVDGVSLVDGYREQLARLLRRGTFDELLATMRRKLGPTDRQ
jgi:phospholipid transport system substrate-binding protein